MNNKRMANREDNMQIDFEPQEKKVDYAELERQYARRESEVENVLEESKEFVMDSKKGVNSVLKGLGGIAETSYGDRKDMSIAQKEAEEKIKKIEDAALGVPEDKEGEVISAPEFEKDISKIIAGLKEEAKELLNDFKEKREEFVEAQITETVKEIKSQYKDKDIFRNRDITNGRNAEDIIIYKTEKEIRVAAKEFIETGNKAKFGIIKVAVRVSSYKEGEEGNETDKKYITGYIINIGGYEKKIGERYSPKGGPLVFSSAREEMRRQKGNVEARLV